MFIDEIKVNVESGKGGDGIVAFRREKHVPLGGPSGGDGGKGGSVIFQADEGLSTLFDLKYLKFVKAKNGENGKIKTMRGKDAEDVTIKVPTGTIIYDDSNNEIIADLTTHRQEVIICQGGLGGKGNSSLASSRNKAPRLQENGAPGEIKEIRLELKLLADVGLVGFPSVGKSTIISMVSGSKPKIADYPFTTLIPNLGVVSVGDGKSFVLADMPGLIKNASLGEGLGIQFLRHIERTRVILHILDMSGYSEREPYEDYQTIQNELAAFNPDLLNRPMIIVANKMDTDRSEEALQKFKSHFSDDVHILKISAYLNEGLSDLMKEAYELLELAKAKEAELIPSFDEDELIVKYEESKPGFTVTKTSEHSYEVSGPQIDYYYQKSNFMTEESVTWFLTRLRKIGVDDALRKADAKNDDTIKIIDFELDFVE